MNIGLGEYDPPPVQISHNPPLDLESRIKMAKQLLKWYHRDYLMGPYLASDPIVETCRINPVFCVPKPDGSVRPVVNYSKKIQGSSLNELLDPEICTVEYLQIREIVYTIKSMGRGVYMWAKDLEDGYFNIKIKERQCKQIAFKFEDLIFIPMVLVFGLSSAPLIFTIFMWYVVMAIRFANSDLMWAKLPTSEFDRSVFQTDASIYEQDGYTTFPLVTYYLDDIFGFHYKHQVWQQYNLAGETLITLGLSTKEAKDRPPATTQRLLGLEYDSILMEVRTPLDKVEKYSKFAKSLMSKDTISKKELFSISGKVRHAAMQCRPLSAFARGIEIYGDKVRRWEHHINMNNRLKRDINLMINGMKRCQSRGLSFDFILKPRKCWELQAYTDASSLIGAGGFVEIDNAPNFQIKWSDLEESMPFDILWKEMAAILILFILYKEQFKNKIVCIWSDNEPDINMLIKWRAPLNRADLQSLIRMIAEICIEYNINPWWEHIKGDRNTTADRLSRFHNKPFEYARVKPREKTSLSSVRSALRSATDASCL